MTEVEVRRGGEGTAYAHENLWRGDGRSVGELLLDADRLARELLLDLGPYDAPGLLRGWGETVQSAADLWRTMPAPGYTTAGRRDAEILERLDSHAQRMHRSQLRVGWPGPGPADERLLRISETFTRAGELVARYHRSLARPELRQPAGADTAAARMRVVHALHVAGHGVLVAVRQHVDAESRRVAGSRDHRATRAIPRGHEARRRLEVFERLAGAYVGGRYAAALDGEHRPQPTGRDRLHSALVSLDIHSHRVLAYDPTPANVTLVARTQAQLMTTTSLVLCAGTTTGALPAAETDRCQPALDAAQTAWADAATTWGRLSGPGPRRTDPDLLAAATEVHAAVAEITHDGATLATPATIAARVDIPEVAHVLQQAGAAAVDLAHVLRETSADTQMRVPARAALVAFTASQAHVAPDPVRPRRRGPEQLGSPVDPRALLRNDDSALPVAVRADLQTTAASAVTAAGAVMTTTIAFDLGVAARLAHPPSGAPVPRPAALINVQSALPLPGIGWTR